MPLDPVTVAVARAGAPVGAEGFPTPAVWSMIASGTLIRAGQVILDDSAFFQALVDNHKTSSRDDSKYRRLTAAVLPRNLAALLMQAIGYTGGDPADPRIRFRKPVITASNVEEIQLVSGRSSAGTYDYDWNTHVRLLGPTDGPVQGDVVVTNARTVEILGLHATADGATGSEGGAIACRGTRDWFWLEGCLLDQTNRTAYHDAINGHGRLDAAGHSAIDRFSHPNGYLIRTHVKGVQGIKTGIHGDIFQAQGPIGWLFVDQFTGYSQYQGLILQSTQGHLGGAIISRTDMGGWSPVDDGTSDQSAYLIWLPPSLAGKDNPIVLFDEVKLKPSGSRTLADGLVWPKATWGQFPGQSEGLDIGWLPGGHFLGEGDPITGLAGSAGTVIHYTPAGTTQSETAHGFADNTDVVLAKLTWKSTGDIASLSWSGGVTTFQTVAAAPGIQVGEVVTIGGGTSVPTAYKGKYLVTAALSANQFTAVKQVSPGTNPGAMAGTATWTVPPPARASGNPVSLSWTPGTGVVTLTTSTAHGAKVGELITIDGDSGVPAAWRGDYLVTQVLSTTQVKMVTQTGDQFTNPGSIAGTVWWSLRAITERSGVYYVLSTSASRFHVAATSGGTPIPFNRDLNDGEVTLRRDFVIPPPNLPGTGIVLEKRNEDPEYMPAVDCGENYEHPGFMDTTPEPASLTIGTVSTLSAGASATAAITGTAPDEVLSLGIPRGNTGPAGPAGGSNAGATGHCYTLNPATAGSSSGAGTAGRTLYARLFGSKTGAVQARIRVGTSSGNIAVAVYDNNGSQGAAARPNNRKATTGSIPCPATGDAVIALAVDVAEGDWAALATSDGTATVVRQSPASGVMVNGLAHFEGTFPPGATASPGTNNVSAPQHTFYMAFE